MPLKKYGIMHNMNRYVTPIDISHIPDLVRIVEEMKDAKEPRILKQGSAPVAMLIPMATATEQHNAIDAFDFKPFDEVRGSLLDAGSYVGTLEIPRLGSVRHSCKKLQPHTHWAVN